ncbi:MAG TPA: hypothetical protein EYP65_04560, partial [Armatimonadetes bacterium]|nr:hypothetical protein [Armatimonadota bacterium]
MTEIERELSFAKGEEDFYEVADLVAKVLSGYFETLRKGLSFVRHFPGFEPKMARVVKVGGRIVSALLVLPFRMRLMGKEVSMG